MAAQGIVGGDASMRHVVRVDWFGRDPGGSTIFVMPEVNEGSAAAPVAERDVDDATRH